MLTEIPTNHSHFTIARNHNHQQFQGILKIRRTVCALELLNFNLIVHGIMIPNRSHSNSQANLLPSEYLPSQSSSGSPSKTRIKNCIPSKFVVTMKCSSSTNKKKKATSIAVRDFRILGNAFCHTVRITFDGTRLTTDDTKGSNEF